MSEAGGVEFESAAAAAVVEPVDPMIDDEDDDDMEELDCVIPPWMKNRVIEKPLPKKKKVSSPSTSTSSGMAKITAPSRQESEQVELTQPTSITEQPRENHTTEESVQMEVDEAPAAPITTDAPVAPMEIELSNPTSSPPTVTITLTPSLVNSPASDADTPVINQNTPIQTTDSTTTLTPSTTLATPTPLVEGPPTTPIKPSTSLTNELSPILEQTPASSATGAPASAVSTESSPPINQKKKKAKKKLILSPGDDSTGAAATFMDDAADEGGDDGDEEEESHEVTPTPPSSSALVMTETDHSPTKDEPEMTADEEAAGLAEMKQELLAKEDEVIDADANLAAIREVDEKREDEQTAMFEKRYRASKRATSTPTPPPIDDATGKPKTFKNMVFQRAEEARALAAAKLKKSRLNLSEFGLDEVVETVGIEKEESDEIVEKRRKERARLLAMKFVKKKPPALTMSSRPMTPTLTNSLTISTSSTTPTSAPLTNTVEQSDATILIDDTPTLLATSPMLTSSSSSFGAPSIPSLTRQDSLLNLASSTPSPSDANLDEPSRHVLSSIRRTNTQGLNPNRMQQLASRVAGGKSLSKPPTPTNATGASISGKENQTPNLPTSNANTSFAKFNEELRRTTSVKLFRQGSFLQRQPSTATFGQTNTTSPSNNNLLRSMSILEGKTDFSSLLPSSTSSSFGPPSKSGSTAVAPVKAVSSSQGGMAAAKKAAAGTKGSKGFVFRTENSRDGFENEHSRHGASNSASGTPISSSTPTPPAPTGPVSFSSFMNNFNKKSTSVASTATATANSLKRQNSCQSKSGYEQDQPSGTSILTKLSKKMKTN